MLNLQAKNKTILQRMIYLSKEIIRKFDDDYAEGQIVKGEDIIATNKKVNVQYWDNLEGHVYDAFLAVAKAGGVEINDLCELFDVKELTENMILRIKKKFPEAEFPYVDEDF
jgi:hypothetical protein